MPGGKPWIFFAGAGRFCSLFPLYFYLILLLYFALQCYAEKGKEAADEMDDDIRPWLKSFVGSVGLENAKILLEGAGNFAKLS